MEKLELSSRYNDVLTELELIDNSRGIVTTNGLYTRVGLDAEEKSIALIDFEGGPMINIGSSIKGKKVKSIRSVYLIEFET